MDDNINIKLHYELNYIPALNYLSLVLDEVRKVSDEHAITLGCEHPLIIKLEEAHKEFIDQLNMLYMIKKLARRP